MNYHLNHQNHQKIATTIKHITFSAVILSCALIINLFHIPFLIGGFEGEKIEFGLVVVFAFLGIIHWKILLTVVTLLPFIDQIMHGHHILMLVPINSIFNAVIFGIIYIMWVVMIKNFSNHFLAKGNFCLICTLLIIIIKFGYFNLIWMIFAQNPETHKPWNLFIVLGTIVSGIKFFLIMIGSLLINKWIKPINI